MYMTKKLAYPTLSMNEQAIEVLNRLKHMTIEDSRVLVQTAAWYNGRERGFSLTFYAMKVTYTDREINRPNFVIAISEHRNCDSIVIDNWPIGYIPMNPPTVSDFNDDAYYRRRRTVPYQQYDEAVDVVRELVRQWMAGEIVYNADVAGWKKGDE
jgi:hypothetical protein